MPVSSWDGAVNPTGNNEHDVVPACKRPSNAEPGSMRPDVEPKSFRCFHFFPQQLHSRVGTVNCLYIFCLNSRRCVVCKHARLARKHECKHVLLQHLHAGRRTCHGSTHVWLCLTCVVGKNTVFLCCTLQTTTPPQYLNTQTYPPSCLWLVLCLCSLGIPSW